MIFSWELLVSIVAAYLLGSFPFAYIIGRHRNIDIRNTGDRNAGAFNVFRHAGFIAGLLTLVLDILKGALSIILAQYIMKNLPDNEIPVLICGVAAMAGHIFPVFLGFRGGRGVSIITGILFVLLPLEISISFIITVIVILLTRNSILGGIILFIPVPFMAYFIGEPLYLIVYSIILPCLAGLIHWLTTRKLSEDEKRESRTFWISS